MYSVSFESDIAPITYYGSTDSYSMALWYIEEVKDFFGSVYPRNFKILDKFSNILYNE